jgi:hypothetical protein
VDKVGIFLLIRYNLKLGDLKSPLMIYDLKTHRFCFCTVSFVICFVFFRLEFFFVIGELYTLNHQKVGVVLCSIIARFSFV